MTRYGKIRAPGIKACSQALAKPIVGDRPTDAYFQKMEDAIQFFQDIKTPFTPAQIVQTAYYAVNIPNIRKYGNNIFPKTSSDYPRGYKYAWTALTPCSS